MHSLKIMMMTAAAVLATGTAQADVISITRDDIGKEFVIDYDGHRSDGTMDSNAKAITVLKLTNVSDNSYSFNVQVLNKMHGDGDAWDGTVTGFGFNSTPDLAAASAAGPRIGGALLGSNVQNIGNVDVYIKSRVYAGDAEGGSATFTFGSILSSIQLSDFFVTYSAPTGGEFGRGTVRDGGTPVPEPAGIALFALAATGLMLGRRRAVRTHHTA